LLRRFERLLYSVNALLPIRTLSFVLFVMAQPADAPAISGDVRGPDGSAVTQGTVALKTSPGNLVTGTIDTTGHFRVAPDSPGRQRMFISVPGYAPHRVTVTVPPSRRIALPPIALHEATYFRARFVTSDGEPLAAGGLRRQSLDGDGLSIPDPLGHVRERMDEDGSVRIGPLPLGRTLLAFDRPGFAQTRLRDIDVNGTQPVIEGGTIVIAPPSRVEVEIVDGRGRLVPRHDVSIEDAIQPSPLSFPSVKTNDEGLAVFDRLSARRYRVWTRTERCNNQELSIARVVSPGAGRARLQIGGRAAIQVTSALGPLIGRPVGASPDSPGQSPWQARFTSFATPMPRPPIASPSCAGATDGDGHVTLASFPPGPAQVRVRLFNSAYIARVTIPNDGREVAVVVPQGLIPARVIDRVTRQGIASAQVTWIGGGSRVEATATANGDVLLEAAHPGGGTMTISARGYQTLEGAFEETPETLQEVSLLRVPSELLQVRVVSAEGESIAGAVVELVASRPGDAAEFVAADSKGIARFVDVPPGALELAAYAEGFAGASVRVADEARAAIVITLTRR
jgi:hypothetical protein